MELWNNKQENYLIIAYYRYNANCVKNYNNQLPDNSAN
jgi:hypothetical protein